MSIVRKNLMTEKGYTPYCGSSCGCRMPRTYFDGHQFACRECGWRSAFPDEFIKEYKAKWGIDSKK